jgi:hypothetical protein
LGAFEPEDLDLYKKMIRCNNSGPEDDVVHAIVTRQENRVVDQELKFQESGVPESDKIDICHFDCEHQCVSLVEVKHIDDKRLYPGSSGMPEVLDQLRRYRARLEKHRDDLAQGCEAAIALKRKLGFGARLEKVPDTGPLSLMKKPVLVIGGCGADDVRRILSGDGEWQALRKGLEDVSSALIVCGQQGCSLDLRHGRQTFVFDPGKW